MWQTFDNELTWFHLQQETYGLLEPDEAGVIRSYVFPGLWLAVPALLEGRMIEVLNTLQRGLESAEHQAFVQHQRQSAQPGSNWIK